MYEETCPRLLPLWNGITIQEFSQKSTSSLDPSMYPDHGGAGVDVIVDDNEVICQELKAASNSETYGSNMCALPFLQPKKLGLLKDPCMGPLLKKRKSQQDICRYLQSMRVHMKCRRKLHKDVLSYLEEIPSLMSKRKFDDVLIPKTLVTHAKRMPKKVPVPVARWIYKGGCLASSQASTEAPLLLHPVGSKLSNLAVTTLSSQSDDLKAFQPKLNEQIIVPLKGGRIFQIAEDPAFNVCCVRQLKKYHYVNLDGLKENEPSSLPVRTYSMKTKLNDIKVSPYVPGEHVIVTEKGHIYLRNAQTRKSVWKLKKPFVHDPFIYDGWWGCTFGAHPRSLLYSDRLMFCSLDIRMEKPKAVPILSSPNPFLLNGEKLTVTKRLKDFQHFVATDFHLLICDERYPQQPVMSWNHMLESLPLYCDVTSYKQNDCDSESVVILGTQESADLASFRFNSSLLRIQPKSLCHPIHLSSPQDYVNAMKLCCQDIDDKVCQRLSLPLAGVCVLPRCEQESFTVLQMTSVGDIFYQDVHPVTTDEKTFRVESGCVLPPLHRIPPEIPTLLEHSVCGMKIHKRKGRKILKVNVKKENLLKDFNLGKSSPFCLLCNDGNENDCSSNYTNDSVCSKCSLPIDFGRRLTNCERMSGLLCGNNFQLTEVSAGGRNFVPLQLVDFSQTTDPLSERFLSAWQTQPEKDIDTQSTFCSVLENRTSPQDDVILNRKDVEAKLSQSSMISEQPSFSMHNSLFSPDFTFDEEMVPPSQELTQRSGLYTSKVNSAKKKKLVNSSLGF